MLIITYILLLLLTIFLFRLFLTRNEGFADFQGRCGVDMPPCPNGTRCMNGFCLADVPPEQPYSSGLPVRV